MKRTFTIPLINVDVTVFSGERGWKQFLAIIAEGGVKNFDGSEVEQMPDGLDSGRHWGSYLWVASIEKTGTLFHEASHLIDDCMRHVCSDDGEFRAYITEYVLNALMKIAIETSNPRPS